MIESRCMGKEGDHYSMAAQVPDSDVDSNINGDNCDTKGVMNMDIVDGPNSEGVADIGPSSLGPIGASKVLGTQGELVDQRGASSDPRVEINSNRSNSFVSVGINRPAA